MDKNEGIIISGKGSVKIENMAAGPNSKVVQNAYYEAEQLERTNEEEIRVLILDLLSYLEGSSNIPNKEVAIQEVQEITEEVKKEEPDRFTLKGLLDSLQSSVGSVADVADKNSDLTKINYFTAGPISSLDSLTMMAR